ncbi:MAG: magnesium/cobalt transporter CorA [Armatimonadetes bacterium]|nr:magnesium/cobalt transporter CorA [Armatimonadota bacterium]NIM23306.1 magnesium/cobalt transporter CorA [Armatimonadota bacterium]NIM67170.1 magnesium/cobalt transporter CorA [Armatimonadota bacterium]NIM75697.1 magnesium/cobalt transporter CorA [Armatimonadota bacterium]NIN05359.1 magnesium/cobalt transporter CorA [Armatimonadota bacterium]
MRKLLTRSTKKIGLPPGALVHVGEKRTETVRISVLDYDEHHIEEKTQSTLDECLAFKDKPTVTWIDVTGLHDVKILERLGACYGIHPLVLEDILNTGQRPKLEDFGEYLFVVLKMLHHNVGKDELVSEQVSLILGSNFVISFQEAEGDVFDPVRGRIRNAKGRIRKVGADYLAYALLDAIVDNYFVVLEKLANRIEQVEEELVARPTLDTLQTIHKLKREMIFLRKSIWPLREVISGFQRLESSLICKDTEIYLRDVYDHAIQVMDTIESFRDILAGMLDTYLSSVSNKMNEVMKVLTIIATVFIPLTFVAGIYGMNFKYMPELEWHWSYPMVWGVMGAVAISMVVFFRKKGWL